MRFAAYPLCLALACVPFAGQTPPDPHLSPPAHQAAIELAGRNALDFTKRLPDFLCTEVIHRYYDPHGGIDWKLLDTLTFQVRYVDQNEDYKLLKIGNKAVSAGTSVDGSDGAMATGEFGSLVRAVFETESRTQFVFEKIGTLRGRKVLVFRYDVQKENSRYTMAADRGLVYVPGHRGELFLDAETSMVLRFVMEPYGLPPAFPIRAVNTTLDYGFANVGGKPYLVPVRAEILSRYRFASTKNIEEFGEYRKFGVDSKLTFDTPEAQRLN